MKRTKSINQERFEYQQMEVEELMKRKYGLDGTSSSVQQSNQTDSRPPRPSSTYIATYSSNHGSVAWTNVVQPPVGINQILTPGMFSTPRVSVTSATPEELDGGYVFCDCQIDTETPKNAMMAGVADYLVVSRSEWQAEMARFFPTHSDVIFESAKGSPALRFDDLFDLPDKLEKYKGHPDCHVIELLAQSPTPYLRLAAAYDLRRPMNDEQALLGKARQILMASGINVSNPYTVNVEGLSNPEGQYRIGMYASRPFDGEKIVHDSEGQAYCIKQIQDKMAFIPLRSITRSGYPYIRPAALPHKSYYLIGVERIERTTVNTIVFTSNPMEVILNADNPSVAVLAWVGGLVTLEIAVKNWEPRRGQKVFYAWNPMTFGGDEEECRRHFDTLRPILTQKECSINILQRSAISRSQMPMFPTNYVSIPVAASSACYYRPLQLESHQVLNTNIYKEIGL